MRHELADLKRASHTLHNALSLATNRLEKAGLPHADLLAPLKEGAKALFIESAAQFEAVTIGPFVWGNPTQTDSFPASLRFVFDCGTNRLAKLQYAKGDEGWEDAASSEYDRFLAWLLEDNEDMIDHPENWGLFKSETLEGWDQEA